MSAVNGILVPLCILLFVTAIILLFYLFFARQGRCTNRSVRRASSRMSDRDTTDGDDNNDRELGLDEATILSYPRIKYSQADKDDMDAGNGSSGSCSICLLDYLEADTVKVLPGCKHFFHVSCVDPWLKLHSTCPNCRKRMITASGRSGRRH